ncbi:MAG: hypothetical protein LBQ05_03410 [Christensenellaceae bacterium]|nr:hypothetical protein [Christensenellaceae bacterium]
MKNELLNIVKELCMAETVPNDFFAEMAHACGYIVLHNEVFCINERGKKVPVSPKDLANDIENDRSDRTFLTQYFLNTNGEINKLPGKLRTAILSSAEYKLLTQNGKRKPIDGAVMELWEHPKENGVIFMEGINTDGTNGKQYFDAEQFEKGIKDKGQTSTKQNEPETTY